MPTKRATTTRPKTQTPNPRLPIFLLALFLALIATTAEANWLITTDGEKIQTVGRYEVGDREVSFVDADRKQRSISLDKVDLEASREASRQAQSITLYATSWCGYCRRARALLNEMGVFFNEKDIELSPEALREYQAKAGRGAGVPVLDIDGTILRGYSETLIRRMVGELQQRQAARAQGASE